MTESAVPAGPDLTRRTFIRAVGVAGLGFALWGRLPDGQLRALAAIPGGTLDIAAVPKFVSPLVVPPTMPSAGPHTYDIETVQFPQQVLPDGYPATTVWSYAAVGHADTRNYPAFTLEAQRGVELTVTWRNHLEDDSGPLPHLLPVDQTLHWANPAGGEAGRDSEPDEPTSEPYTGPVPLVPHVHGMERAYEWSDGYPEAWFLPPSAAQTHPDHAQVGTFYDYYQSESGQDWAPGSATFRYPNTQRASTAWYHDHALGMTRLNVYAGPAGFYLVRDDDPAEQPTDGTTGQPAVLPEVPYEIPLAIQDRSFNTDGSLFYPDTRAFFDGYPGPFVPQTDVAPIWNPEFFGNTMVVNGRTWPYLDVEPRRYRLRILNGCQSRFLLLELDRRPGGLTFDLIGTEGGFLRAPVSLRQLLLAPAERADVILDFTRVPAGTSITLLNTGPDAPFGGLPVTGRVRADRRTTGQVMQFRVGATSTGPDGTTPPARLVLPPLAPLPQPTRTRRVALLERMDMAAGIPVEALLGDDTFATSTSTDPHDWSKAWSDPITENPDATAVEEWEIWNFTVDAHPIHVHEVFFEVVGRQPFDAATRTPTGRVSPPPAWENGRKDTVIAYPGQITRIRMQFGTGGLFVWHCHIVEHEDNEMMRPYHVGPIPDEVAALLARHPDHGGM